MYNFPLDPTTPPLCFNVQVQAAKTMLLKISFHYYSSEKLFPTYPLSVFHLLAHRSAFAAPIVQFHWLLVAALPVSSPQYKNWRVDTRIKRDAPLTYRQLRWQLRNVSTAKWRKKWISSSNATISAFVSKHLCTNIIAAHRYIQHNRRKKRDGSLHVGGCHRDLYLQGITLKKKQHQT